MRERGGGGGGVRIKGVGMVEVGRIAFLAAER